VRPITLPDPDARYRTYADVLRWQGRFRVAVAVVVGSVSLALQQAGVLADGAPWLLLAAAGYMIVVATIGWQVHDRQRAGNFAVAIVVAADIAFVFSSIVASSAPASYERILILSLFVVHVTESHFGRAHAAFVVAASVIAYCAVVAAAIDYGANVQWADQLWSIGLFAGAGVCLIVQHGGFRRRLERIVDLFASAEAGDFSKAYDTESDKRPDIVTRVGRAYNQVRLRLASLVLTDPLTGCLNRRGLDQSVSREIARASRAGSDLSLLAIDIDHFKSVNDRFGHVAGDIVLREFGALLTHTARAGDVVSRTGGEEFAILLPDTDLGGALRAGERLCAAARAHVFLINGKRVPLTVSVGVVSTSAIGNDSSGATMMERADEALYSAKHGGRDRVSVWTRELAIV
jgi:diguanylate cyclase (GGDEF)-like protein